MNTSMSPMKRSFRRGMSMLSIVAVLWLLACFSAAAWLWLGASDGAGSASEPGRTQSRVAPAASAALASAPPRCGYEPIESIRVGERVVTPGTDLSKPLPTRVDEATWKLVKLRMVNRWHDGTLDDMQIAALEPPRWFNAHHVEPGAKVPLPVDVADLGEPGGLAKVLSVESCPPIQPGPGRVVLTTINHLNNFVFSLTVKDAAGAESTVGVTGWHKLYSESRGWVSTCTLKRGETLRGREGPLTVASLVRRHETDRVYNMTVEGEHVYYVSGLDLLSHNAASCVPDNANRPPDLTREGAGRQGAFNEAKRDAGIPTSQQPSAQRLVPDRTNPGKYVREYDYTVPREGGGTDTVTIRDDQNGHVYGPGDPQNRGPHFNGPNGGHYDY